MRRIISSLFIVLIFLFVCCKTTKRNPDTLAYVIDPKIQKQLDQNITSMPTPSGETIVMGSMNLKLFENDSLIWDTKEKNLDCMIMSNLEGDTAVITGFFGFTAGLGFKIYLFRDSCIVRYFAKTDAAIYKLKKDDQLNYGVYVPCLSYKLTLTEKPAIKKGEVIKGIVELKSDVYYEHSKGKDNDCRAELTGYFVTEPLMTLKDQYEQIKKK